MLNQNWSRNTNCFSHWTSEAYMQFYWNSKRWQWPDAGLILFHRLWHWPNFKTTLGNQHLIYVIQSWWNISVAHQVHLRWQIEQVGYFWKRWQGSGTLSARSNPPLDGMFVVLLQVLCDMLTLMTPNYCLSEQWRSNVFFNLKSA